MPILRLLGGERDVVQAVALLGSPAGTALVQAREHLGDGRLATDLVGQEAEGLPARVLGGGGDFAVGEALGEPMLAGDFGERAAHALAAVGGVHIDAVDEAV